MCKESENIQYPGNISQKIYSKNIGKLWSRYYNISGRERERKKKNSKISDIRQKILKYETPIILNIWEKIMKRPTYEKDLSKDLLKSTTWRYLIFVEKKSKNTRRKNCKLEYKLWSTRFHLLIIEIFKKGKKKKKISDRANLSKGARKNLQNFPVFVNWNLIIFDTHDTRLPTRVASIRLRLRTEVEGGGGGFPSPWKCNFFWKANPHEAGSPRHATSNLCVRFEELSRATCFSRKIRLLASFPIPGYNIKILTTSLELPSYWLFRCHYNSVSPPFFFLLFQFFLSLPFSLERI